eukprot:TRINITY_DN1583_c0_g2_i2.p1 TRINITY_DN1583_c0_g2~~TRINITY_DN1583_c0_g2_i2.p1  ORF type:complete len:871 (-),score=219.97 TRINITY_DN1583_c0_g2_i2:150-2762(-)
MSKNEAPRGTVENRRKWFEDLAVKGFKQREQPMNGRRKFFTQSQKDLNQLSLYSTSPPTNSTPTRPEIPSFISAYAYTPAHVQSPANRDQAHPEPGLYDTIDPLTKTSEEGLYNNFDSSLSTSREGMLYNNLSSSRESNLSYSTELPPQQPLSNSGYIQAGDPLALSTPYDNAYATVPGSETPLQTAYHDYPITPPPSRGMSSLSLSGTLYDNIEATIPVKENLYISQWDAQYEDLQVEKKKQMSAWESATQLDADDQAAFKRLLKEGHRDWNREYIQLVQKLNDFSQVTVSIWKSIATLAREFVDTARLYAKILISELCLPDSQKTIPAKDLGGVAGGQKFVFHGIIFKLALDTKLTDGDKPFWMYGGQHGACDVNAMKAAKNDLKGMEAWNTTRVDGFNSPLIAVIDYKGYRMTAMSVLPLDSDTLKYGSDNAGRSVHTDIPELNNMFQAAAGVLNLKGHVTGSVPGKKQIVYGPGDLEGHLGTDGRYYVCDFGRLFPCEDPAYRNTENKRVVFCTPLRPEFVKFYPRPLCSDAFTSWNSDDNFDIRNRHNQEVSEATKYLYEVTIPQFAGYLDTLNIQLEDNMSKDDIEQVISIFGPAVFHSRGINMRHMGYVRERVQNVTMRKLLLSACVARVVKDRMKSMMRDRMHEVRVPSDEPFREAIVSVFNLMLGQNKSSNLYWLDEVKDQIREKFVKCLSPAEESDTFNLKDAVDIRFLLMMILELTGIQIQKKASTHLLRRPHSFRFVESDIKRNEEKVKFFCIRVSVRSHVAVDEGEEHQWTRVYQIGQRFHREISQKFLFNADLSAGQFDVGRCSEGEGHAERECREEAGGVEEFLREVRHRIQQQPQCLHDFNPLGSGTEISCHAH